MDRGEVSQEVSRGVEEHLAKKTVGEIFVDGEEIKRKVESNQAKLRSVSGKACFAVTTIGPEYYVDTLWPEEEIGQTGVALKRLRVADAIWWGMTEEARKDIGTAAVSDKLHREEDAEKLKVDAKDMVEAVFSTGAMDLAPQETEELTYPGGQGFWEAMVVLGVKMGVTDFSLHLPFLRNLNLPPKGEKNLFNIETMCISGYIPPQEISRLQEAAKSVEEEKKARADETVAAAKAQIDWYRRMKEKYGLNKGKKVDVTVHLSSVGMGHHIEEADLARGIANLAELQKYAGEDFSLMVETQGLEPDQLDRLLTENPKVKLVFDAAHVKIENARYGDFWKAIEKYKDRIGVIHFAQPIEVDGEIKDAHMSFSKEGVFSEEDKKRIAAFARDGSIWLTFESDFLKKDFDLLISSLEK